LRKINNFRNKNNNKKHNDTATILKDIRHNSQQTMSVSVTDLEEALDVLQHIDATVRRVGLLWTARSSTLHCRLIKRPRSFA